MVFDLDGTLIDTERLYAAAFRLAAMDAGWAVPAGVYERLVGLAGTARRGVLRGAMGDGCSLTAFLAGYYAHRERLTADGIACRPGAAAVLDRLDALGLPRAVATSASAATALLHLRSSGLASRVDAVVTRDHVARPKPDPACFVQAASLLGVAAGDCLAVEDSALGVRAARAAGLMVAMVPDVVAPCAATRRLCDVVLGGLADVAALLPGDAAELPSLRGRFTARV